MTFMVMEADICHHTLSARWRTRKASSVIQSKSESPGTRNPKVGGQGSKRDNSERGREILYGNSLHVESKKYTKLVDKTRKKQTQIASANQR